MLPVEVAVRSSVSWVLLVVVAAAAAASPPSGEGVECSLLAGAVGLLLTAVAVELRL